MTKDPFLLAGRYAVGDLIGYGGMAEVHRGRDLRLGREIAVKVLREDLARDATFQDRFRREARYSTALNHPAIVAVYDSGEDESPSGDRVPFIIMELVEGRTLKAILAAEQHLPPRRALEIIAETCSALEFSHRHGIVHRDVKPDNVMLTPHGQVKVMDFGIAHHLAGEPMESDSVIGTAHYLSPEQARGEAVDARSDVYSAGCVLFELLVGQPPFVGDGPVSVAYQQVRADPPVPSRQNREVSPAVDAIVLKALAKNPADRYQSAAEMRQAALWAVTRQQAHSPHPTEPAPRRPAVYYSQSRAVPTLSDGTPVVPIITYVPDTARTEFSGSTVEELERRLELLKQKGDRAISQRDMAQLTDLRQEESAVAMELLRRFRSAPADDGPPKSRDSGGRLPDPSRSTAVLVGTSRYADPELPDIPAVSHNLADLRALLIHRRNGGFADTGVHISENPGRDVGDWIAELAENVEDTLFVYYTGHGMTGSDGELYLGLPGTKTRRPMFSGLPYHELRKAVADSPARNKVIALDCCYSGHAIGLMSGDDVHGGAIDVQGTYVITSTSAVQRAHAPEGARHSAFTGELVDLLTHGTADSGSLIRLVDIYAQLRQRLSGRGLPKPQQRGVDTVADLALTRNPAWSS
jgi:serine/threonine protein kinase